MEHKAPGEAENYLQQELLSTSECWHLKPRAAYWQVVEATRAKVFSLAFIWASYMYMGHLPSQASFPHAA